MIQYLFPTKSQCAQEFINNELDVPDFLLDENDPNYIPSHLVLLHLLQMNLR